MFWLSRFLPNTTPFHQPKQHFNQCLLCLAPCDTSLCLGCYEDLPWLGNHCQQCALPLPHQGICGHCLTQSPAFDQVWTPWLFESPIKELIHQFKYQGNLRSEHLLTSLTASYFHSRWQLTPFDFDLILPVPLHYRRLFMRGFNQAYQLANAIGKRLQHPVDNHVIRRMRHTLKQEGLSAKQRKTNLLHAFAINTSVKDKHILLVDDVITTGATAQAISQLLKQQGAKTVNLICMARTPSHH